MTMLTNHKYANHYPPRLLSNRVTLWSKYIDQKYKRDGHLFKERIISEPVNDMGYFIVLLRYIYYNPWTLKNEKNVTLQPRMIIQVR